MLGNLSAGVRGALVGAAVAGAFGLGSTLWSYQLGKANERAASALTDFNAVVERVEEEAGRLAGVAETAELRLAADRAWRSEQSAQFMEEMRSLTASAQDLRRQFDANPDGACPGLPDDVRLYNAAFGLTPAEPGAGDPRD